MVRRRELVARNDAQIEARRLTSARPSVAVPAGLSIGEMLAAATHADQGYTGPKRCMLLQDALDRDGGMVYHALQDQDEPAEE